MTLDKAYGPLINGVFELDGADIHPVISPSTGERLADLHYCNERDVERAVLAAEAAFPSWKALGQQARARLVAQLADVLENDLERMAQIDAQDVGRCISEVRRDYQTAVRHYRYFAAVVMGHEDSGRSIADGYSLAKREPLGVCGQIIPGMRRRSWRRSSWRRRW